MHNHQKLLLQMMDYYKGDPKRIQHFLKVHSFCVLLGQMEQLDSSLLFCLETTAIVHDIGIKEAEKKYGSSSGKLQEKEGPPIARELLSSLGYEDPVIERVCYLIAHHHTYQGINGLDYQILVEADFLVNLYEEASNKDSIRTVLDKIFKTNSGRMLLKTIFDL